MRSVLPVLKLLPLLVVVVASRTSFADDYRDLFAKVDPSVVVLYTVERVAAPQLRSGETSAQGLGSGFLINDEGYIITAAHVVQTADKVRAELVDGTQIDAKIIASNPVKDVALLKLASMPSGIKPAKLGDSDKVRVGEEILVIGAPYGLSHTLSVGHISARHTNDGSVLGEVQAETFQTDAAINQGNSGGPMFNRRGEVIGVVSYIRSRSGGSEGLGFAVTSNAAYEALFEQRTPWSGMSGVLLTGELAAALNVPQESGYLVQRVASDSPAARLGLRPSRIPARIGQQELFIGGDIILSLNNISLAPGKMREMMEMRKTAMKTGSVAIRVLRDGEVITLDAPIPGR
ncbi:MAG: trypsin-like peptidase domain-containing protein [Pseudomonadota bacterium]